MVRTTTNQNDRTEPSSEGGEIELPEPGDILDVVHEETDGLTLYPRGIVEARVEDVGPDGYYDLTMLDADGNRITGRNIAEYRVKANLDAHDGAFCILVPAKKDDGLELVTDGGVDIDNGYEDFDPSELGEPLSPDEVEREYDGEVSYGQYQLWHEVIDRGPHTDWFYRGGTPYAVIRIDAVTYAVARDIADGPARTYQVTEGIHCTCPAFAYHCDSGQLCKHMEMVESVARGSGESGKTYRGRFDPSAVTGSEYIVTVDGQPLPRRFDLLSASPTGFSWGFRGSGPAQLAIAILADAYDDEFAVKQYQRFKDDVIAKLPEREWVITREDVDDWRDSN